MFAKIPVGGILIVHLTHKHLSLYSEIKINKHMHTSFFFKFAICSGWSGAASTTSFLTFFYPPTNSPNWSLYISLTNFWENLIKDQSIFSVLISLIIITPFSLEKVWISLAENCCWSLWGLKGLTTAIFCH